ncbi:sensor histidine kinase [Spirillospora sp. CA-142024]|uniref:sensor histidine kinase n=1 Tax=Spirillospora sp. CA-142024 TaxID=3240036 RepID=UPI003D9374BB
MSASNWTQRALRRHPHICDAAVVAVLYAVMLLTTAQDRRSIGACLAAGVACVALMWRRRSPFPVLAVTTAAVAFYVALTRGHGLALAAPMIALYNAADTAGTTGRRRALTFGWLAVLGLAFTHAGLRPSLWADGWQNVAVIALGGLALAAGDAARSRRDYIAEIEERARHAERDRDREAARRVTEERLRIARDLHDVVGHHLALINLQAGVAAHVLDKRPDQTRQSLAYIRQASRTGLDELRDTIGLLREPGDPAAPTEPTVGLAGFDELVDSFARAGLRIERGIEGTARPLPAATDLTAYRVLQESLTNIRKHAHGAAAHVQLSYSPSGLRIRVEDDGNGRVVLETIPGRGHGIAGMHERVTAIGGHLHTGPRPEGGFSVDALLPLSQGGRP